MSNTSDCNVHGPEFREAKPSQGHPARPASKLFRLDNRTTISSLGTTLAIAILESGADIVCLDIPPTPTAANWNKVEATATNHAGQLFYYSLDITDENAVAETFATFGPTLRYPLKGLVSCAGLSLNGTSTDFPAASFCRMLDINVTGTFLVAQATAREMAKTRSTGSMVLVASMSGYVSNKGVDTAGCNAPKAAIYQLTCSLAAEWGSRVGIPLIRVNSLSPGYIRTAATAEALQKPGMESQ
ncbi:short-chain dehydrogenase [Aspergillus ruber CBS 135680]|uniref:Short-chain dehydrogenase n=1 Tax=Aspergillus ruber (strain CBS 135680) TaxID=1388766 RepID=A0A017S028_ASPRC|nr:short-chain dehydrogenase [Aspergillus ruber CBS 135680]EYE90302.1 short-chain dehydrogenase [Aspergillus ruber CBS 135680]